MPSAHPRSVVIQAAAATWPLLVELFTERGAVEGCWCQFWRCTTGQFAAQRGDANRRRLKALIDKDDAPGLLALRNDLVVGWCSVGPREHFARIERSRTLRRIDDRLVWAIPCFFVRRDQRSRGVATDLLDAAAAYARANGATCLEGYPVAGGRAVANADAFTGRTEMFTSLGFVAVASAGARTIMRLDLQPGGP